MRFLADENIPGLAVNILRGLNHDVAWVVDNMAGSNDPAVMSCAVEEQRVLLTFDKDFGELVFRDRSRGVSGVILFRFDPQSDTHAARVIADAIGSRNDWAGMFSVVEPGRIRMTPLPGD